VSAAPQETAPQPVPQAKAEGDPAEDLRRDEVLCRLLNTPYRPAHKPSTALDPDTAAPAPELAET
jgi:hypothetical protein